MLDRLKNRPIAVALLLGIAAELLFVFHIGRPTKVMFDEVHYLPAARALLHLTHPVNPEHPLLAKELIALGMAVFGDNPFGWRIAASLAGAATVMASFAFLWLFFRTLRPAVIGALLVSVNQLVFIQARIAMLDGFLAAFLMWSIVVMLWAMWAPPGKAWGRWIFGAVLIGLATAVKWEAAPYVAFAALAFLVIRWRDARRMARADAPRAAKLPLGRTLAAALSGRSQRHWPGMPAIPAILLLGVVSVTTYFLTYLPAFFYAQDPLTLGTLLPFTWDMYALQTQVLRPHPYQSSWWTWPLVIRPIWYFYEWDSGAQRGVLLIGNVLVMWGGLVAVLACYWAWLKSRAARPLAVAILWTASLAIWAIIPKSLGFYYYYNMSGIFICLALATAFHHFDAGRNKGREEWFLGAAVMVFAYFYPIVSAAPLSSPDGFTYWMWFGSWR